MKPKKNKVLDFSKYDARYSEIEWIITLPSYYFPHHLREREFKIYLRKDINVVKRSVLRTIGWKVEKYKG